MAVEKDFELLDDYITNRLTASERVDFEQKLATDPELTSEYQIQHKIAESIRQARAAELKTMLSNVPVATLPTSASVVGKIATVAVTLGVVVTAFYFYFNSNSETSREPQQSITNNPSPETSQPDVIIPENKEPVIEDQSAQSKESNQHKPKSKIQNPSEKQASEKSPIDVYDPAEEQVNEAKTDLPNEATLSVNSPSFAVETDNSNKKYNFHYQFKDGKLFLYGSFEKNLYEIMEFFSENKRTVFLFYKNNYYLLLEDNQKIKALSPVNDPALLKKLREFRSR